MQIHELAAGIGDALELRPLAGAFDPVPEKRAEIVLRQATDDEDEAWMLWQDGIYPVAGHSPRQQARLIDIVRSGLPHLAWVASAARDRVVVQLHRFELELHHADALEIGVDEAICADLRRRFHVGGANAELLGWLAERVLLPPARGAEPRRAAISAGSGADVSAGFRILGRGLSIDVKRSAGRLLVERVQKGAPRQTSKLCLLHAPLSFVDASVAGAMSAGIRHSLEEALRSSKSYFKLWEAYSQIERKQLTAKARRVGVHAYTRVERRSEGLWRFHLKDADPELAKRLGGREGWSDLELVATKREPEIADEADKDKDSRSADELVAAVVDVAADGRSVDLGVEPGDDESAGKPPDSGFLSLSLAGSRVQISRRERARERLQFGAVALPQLALLLEERPAPRARRRRHDPLSPAVLAAFRGAPTERQIEALDIALNTPDIAVIQGPPGTGKTQVISALERRLAELPDEGDQVAHRVLVTSAQHDAVENIVQRTDVFGLPAVKVGAPRPKQRLGPRLDSVDLFRADRCEQVRADLRARPVEELLRRAHAMVVSCLRAPLPPRELAQSLRALHALLVSAISPERSDELLARAAALERMARGRADTTDSELRLRAVRGLRTDSAGFLDDGRLQAVKALSRLKDALSPAERALLERCAAWEEPVPPPFLRQVQALRDRLIDSLIQPPAQALPARDAETERLLTELVGELAQRRLTSASGEAAALAAYLDDLENDPEAVREALEHYTVVLGTTCQQVDSRGLREVRGIETGMPPFLSVIIDEAARVSPLDLFIPMSAAERRVVLVGDHRQLPHLLEPDVERELRAQVAGGDLSAEALEAVQASLFARLWRLLRQLEESDGIRRTVTLDVQYRMTPVLGAFVSRNFYESFGDSRIASGRRQEEFAHDLPGYSDGGKPRAAAWLAVPGGSGRWERRGRSKSRRVEAQALARELRRIIDHDPRLTFGVIAFYLDQVDELAEAMCQQGLCERPDRGGFQVAARYQHTLGTDGKPVERLRIGTVDAFQGREFDVVLLSITRSNDLPARSDEELRRKYGHLLLVNRLCVAMSRQRRLLIAAGDLAFAREAAALPALRDFISLCEGEHGVLL